MTSPASNSRHSFMSLQPSPAAICVGRTIGLAECGIDSARVLYQTRLMHKNLIQRGVVS